MREVVARIHPVSIHGTKVLNLELDERRRELGLVPLLLREPVGLKLEAAAHNIHQELNHGIHGREDVREEDEADNDGVLLHEAEISVQRGVVDESREEGENVENVNLLGDC